LLLSNSVKETKHKEPLLEISKSLSIAFFILFHPFSLTFLFFSSLLYTKDVDIYPTVAWLLWVNFWMQKLPGIQKIDESNLLLRIKTKSTMHVIVH
jgi:hypothetical protein